jgi:hypothetical protein
MLSGPTGETSLHVELSILGGHWYGAPICSCRIAVKELWCFVDSRQRAFGKQLDLQTT